MGLPAAGRLVRFAGAAVLVLLPQCRYLLPRGLHLPRAVGARPGAILNEAHAIGLHSDRTLLKRTDGSPVCPGGCGSLEPDLIMRFRQATRADAMAVATLHAESWRANYRGAYRDEYLDGDVLEDRLRVWEERLCTPAPNQFVVLAEEGDDLIGFACVYGGHRRSYSPSW